MDEKSSFSIHNDLARAIVNRADARQTMRHRFEIDDPETFRSAGHGKSRHTTVNGMERCLVHRAQKEHGIANAKLLREGFESADIVPAPHYHELRRRYLLPYQRPGADQLIVALISLALHDAPHDQDRLAMHAIDHSGIEIPAGYLRIASEREVADVNLTCLGMSSGNSLCRETGWRNAHLGL